MAYHLLLKNNSVFVTTSQNREEMHDNSFLTFIRWGTDGILEKLWLFNFKGVLTNFLQILQYIVFLTAFIASQVSLLLGEEASEEAWKWNDNKASGRRLFGLHMLFQVPIWHPFWKCEINVSIMLTCLISFRSLKSIMLIDSITGHLRIVTN